MQVRMADKFVEDVKTTMSVFRKTTREFHVGMEHRKLLHGAAIGRYNPIYDRVWTKSPEVQIVGVKDRFGYDNKNSPNFVKPAEGQVSAMGSAVSPPSRRATQTQV